MLFDINEDSHRLENRNGSLDRTRRLTTRALVWSGKPGTMTGAAQVPYLGGTRPHPIISYRPSDTGRYTVEDVVSGEDRLEEYMEDRLDQLATARRKIVWIWLEDEMRRRPDHLDQLATARRMSWRRRRDYE